MSSDAPQPPSNDPSSVNFWLEHYKKTCNLYATEQLRLNGEVELLKLQYRKEIDKLQGEKDELQGKYNDLSGKFDEIKSENEELKSENAFLKRQLGMADAGRSRTPSRATASEKGIGLRTPPSSTKGISPPLNVRRSRASGASGSSEEKDKGEENSSEDENLADFARRIRAHREPRNGADRRREQRQERRDAQPKGAEWSGPHPIRWGPKPGATKDKGKQTRKRDAPDSSSDSDTPLAHRGSSSSRASGSSKRMRLEGVFPPPLTTNERRRYTPISSTPPPSSGSGAMLIYPSEEDDKDEGEDGDEDGDEDEDESNKDGLFSLTSLTPVSSRPSSPISIDPESRTLPGPHPPQEPREAEASAPIVRHFRSPSRELSYFDPVPQRHVPNPPEVQPTQPESQVEAPQAVHHQPSPVSSGSGVSSSVLRYSWSFTDRAMAGLAADPPDLHPFSTAARTRSLPLRHFAFPSAGASTSTPTSMSRASPPPPPETLGTPQTRRPLDIVRDRLRREAQNRSGVLASEGSSTQTPASLPPATSPSLTIAPPTRPTASATISRVSPAPRPIANTPMSSATTMPIPPLTAAQVTTLPSTSGGAVQPLGSILPPSMATSPPSVTTSPPTELPITVPASTVIGSPSISSPPHVPATTQNSGAQSGATLSTPTCFAEAGPSQPSTAECGQTTITQLLHGIKTRVGPPLLSQDTLDIHLSSVDAPYSTGIDNPEILRMVFSREFISQTFGGSSAWTCTVCRDDRRLLFVDPAFDSHVALCPGFPGLLLRTSGMQDWKGDRVLLFIKTETAQHWYLGTYELQMVAPLTQQQYTSLPLVIKRKWAENIVNKMKHRDVRVGIVLRRRLGREPDEVELANAVSDGDDYKDISRDEIIQAYEQGHQTMSIFRALCVGYDVAFMSDVAQRLPAYLARRVEQQAVQEPRVAAIGAAHAA